MLWEPTFSAPAFSALARLWGQGFLLHGVARGGLLLSRKETHIAALRLPNVVVRGFIVVESVLPSLLPWSVEVSNVGEPPEGLVWLHGAPTVVILGCVGFRNRALLRAAWLEQSS